MGFSPPPGPTWLYQAYCEHSALLYVGVAYDVERRLQQHRSTKKWWPGVDAVVACQYPTRAEAMALESRIIVGALPAHNIAGKPTRRTPPSSPRWVLLDAKGRVLEERCI